MLIALISQAFSDYSSACHVGLIPSHYDPDAGSVGGQPDVWYSARDMDYLWTPWRYTYITATQVPTCIFCELLRSSNDRKSLIVYRGEHNFIILNAFPYTSGHSMVVPYEHLDQLHKLPHPAATEMMALSQRLETALIDLYRPDGVNLGMNIGKAAGAGIAEHIHMHVLPRWIADANFMTVVGETRVLPEALETTYERLKAKF